MIQVVCLVQEMHRGRGMLHSQHCATSVSVALKVALEVGTGCLMPSKQYLQGTAMLPEHLLLWEYVYHHTPCTL